MNQYFLNPTSRRDFIKTSAVLGGALLTPLGFSASAATNDQKLKVGLIGCGGRGTGAANQALNADKNVVLTAMADIFETSLRSSLGTLQKENPEKVQIAPENCFVGLNGFQKVIDSGVDLVILTTPPGFRPQHLKAAVDAGKHIFCEKPMGVDIPGVKRIIAAAEQAKSNRHEESTLIGRQGLQDEESAAGLGAGEAE